MNLMLYYILTEVSILDNPKIILIDKPNWPRRTHYDAYSKSAKCSAQLTHVLDVSKLCAECQSNRIKFYPAMIVLISEIINQMPEFRMTLDGENQLGFWNFVSPSYTIFHEDDKTFSSINTAWEDSKNNLYHNLIADMKKYQNVKGISPSPELKNIFHISCLPWLSFNSFDLQLYSNQYLSPIITWGRYSEDNGKIQMPISVTINHAAADGYHICQLLIKLQTLCNQPLPFC